MSAKTRFLIISLFLVSSVLFIPRVLVTFVTLPAELWSIIHLIGHYEAVMIVWLVSAFGSLMALALPNPVLDEMERRQLEDLKRQRQLNRSPVTFQLVASVFGIGTLGILALVFVIWPYALKVFGQ